MTAEPWPPAPERAAGRGDDGGRRDRLDEHVDRAAAGEAHVPGLLVADAVADDPGVAGRAGALDLLGRGALDAAAADRPGDPAVGGVQQHGALGSRRGPERADDDGPADVDAVAPARYRSVSSSSFIGAASVRMDRSASPPTTVGGAATVGHGRPGERRVGGRLAPPPRVAGADAAEDLAEALEVGDRAGRQEVVDVRDRRRASRRRAAGSRACRRAG